MAAYAIKRGVPKELILLEDQSRNTEQNMEFSQIVAYNDYGNDNFKACFFTSLVDSIINFEELRFKNTTKFIAANVNT